MRCGSTMHLLLLLLLPALCAPSHVATWEFHGPFPIGKTELDADPTGGALALLARGSGASTPSELVPGGAVVGYTTVPADASGAATLQPAVDWNALVQRLSDVAVLEWQGWAIGAFAVARASARVRIHCTGVVAAFLLPPGNASQPVPLAGDIYASGWVASQLALRRGSYRLLLRLRAKVSARFSCSATQSAPGGGGGLQVLAAPALPDVVGGAPLGDVLSLVVANSEPAWVGGLACEVRAAAAASAANLAAPPEQQPLPPALARLAPGSLLLLPCRLALPLPPALACTPGSDSVLRLSATVVSTGGSGGALASPPYALALQCRSPGASALMTFLDHDGAVSTAGVLPPLASAGPPPPADAPPPPPAPILLSLHGTGVSGRSQVDAYKQKPRGAGGSAPYAFGVAGYWLLAPERHGAHNHAGVGLWSAFGAVQALGALCGRGRREGLWWWARSASAPPAPPPADTLRLLYAGHSMGGAGAWGAAAAAPDLAIAAAPAAGWLVKEAYSDANVAFRLDAGEPAVAPRLAAVLLGAVREQRLDAFAGALRGVPTHIRVGREDATVPAYYSRRMARLLREAGAGSAPEAGAQQVALEEVAPSSANPEAGHWWWDSVYANDGGVLNDGVMRGFYAAHAQRASGASAAAAPPPPPPPPQQQQQPRAAAPHTLPTEFLVQAEGLRAQFGGRGGLSIVSGAGTLAVRAVDEATAAGGARRGWLLSARAGKVTRLRLVLRGGWEVAGVAAGGCNSSSASASAPAALGSGDLPPSFLCLPDGATRVELALGARGAPPSPLHLCCLGCAERAAGRPWAPCPGFDPAREWAYEGSGGGRGPHSGGPARAVTAAPFAIVVGTGSGGGNSSSSSSSSSSSGLLALGVLLSQLHALAAHSTAPVVLDRDLAAAGGLPAGYNAIIVGGPGENSLARAVLGGRAAAAEAAVGLGGGAAGAGERGFPPLSFEAGGGGGFFLGGRRFGSGSALAAVLPLPPAADCSSSSSSSSSNASWEELTWAPLGRGACGAGGLALLLAPGGGARGAGLAALAAAALPTVPPMVRAPFSNLWPDFVALEAEEGGGVAARGWGAALAAGSWRDEDWGVAEGAFFAQG